MENQSDKNKKEDLPKFNQEEVFEKLNASAQKTLDALMGAYEAGMKGGISEEEQTQMIELMRRAKVLRDKIKDITSQEEPSK